MKAFNRVNSHGRQYYFTEVAEGITSIRNLKNELVVAHDIDKLRQSWYDWQIMGMYIQHAFEYLTPTEREFLITGLTDQTWKRLFEGTEKESL